MKKGILFSGLLGAVLALAALHFNHNVEIEVSIQNNGDPVEVFYNLADHGFTPLLKQGWRSAENALQTRKLQRHTLRPITAFRIDPAISPQASLLIGPIIYRTAWGERTLTGEALRQAIGERHNDLRFDGLEGQQLKLEATGEDPQVTISIEQALQWPPLLIWLTAALAGGLIGASLMALGMAVKTRLPPRLRPRPATVIMLLVVTLLTAQAAQNITTRSIYGDGVQNANIVHNLFNFGVFSHERGDSPSATNYREPLPAFVAKTLLSAQQQITDYQIKRTNLAWVFLGLLGTWLLAQRVTGYPLAGFFAVSVSWFYFFGAPQRIDTFYTELQSGTLLVWSGVALHGMASKKRWSLALAAGLCLGLLTLTKGMAFYVSLVAIPLLTGMMLLRDRRRGMALGLCLVLGFAATVTPWAVRNAYVAGDMGITDRGGLILYGRAVLNGMSNEEVKGIFYLYGPRLYHRLVKNTSFSAVPEDLQRGGRWQRLNRGASDFAGDDLRAQSAGAPENAISFHRQVSAEYVKRIREFTEAGADSPRISAGKSMHADAIEMIRADIPRHLMMTVPYLWRGFWDFPHAELPALSIDRHVQISELTNAVSGMALFTLLVWALFKRQINTLAWILVPVGIIAAYSLLTHNIPRYLAPITPIMIVALSAVIAALYRRASNFFIT
jgi:hypothetical protein